MSRKERIEQHLRTQLAPSFLSVENESANHNVPIGSETHFKVIVVSDHFAPLSRLARHRQINQLLTTEFEQGLHALSMHLYTEKEWETHGLSVPQSPLCRGGSKLTK